MMERHPKQDTQLQGGGALQKGQLRNRISVAVIKDLSLPCPADPFSESEASYLRRQMNAYTGREREAEAQLKGNGGSDLPDL